MHGIGLEILGNKKCSVREEKCDLVDLLFYNCWCQNNVVTVMNQS